MAKCGYLYGSDLILILERFDNKYQQKIETVEIYKNFITNSLEGRTVIHEPQNLLIMQGARIEIKEPSVKNGSEATQKDGIAIGYLMITPPAANYSRYVFYSYPNLWAFWTNQPDNNDNMSNKIVGDKLFNYHADPVITHIYE